MENIFSNLQKDNFRRFLRQATTAEAIKDLLHEADTQSGDSECAGPLLTIVR